MSAKWSFRLALLALWVSVPVVALGTYWKSIAPQYPAYEREASARMRAGDSGRDRGPAIAIGLALASAWPFVAVCSAFVAGAATCGVLVVQCVTMWRRVAGVLASVVVGACCALAAFAAGSSAAESFRWGFAVLGGGEVLAAAGFSLAAVAGVVSSLTLETHDRSRWFQFYPSQNSM